MVESSVWVKGRWWGEIESVDVPEEDVDVLGGGRRCQYGLEDGGDVVALIAQPAALESAIFYSHSLRHNSSAAQLCTPY